MNDIFLGERLFPNFAWKSYKKSKLLHLKLAHVLSTSVMMMLLHVFAIVSPQQCTYTHLE
jgi:hypothetical protein